MLSQWKDMLLLAGDTESARAELRDIFKESYHLLEAENIAQAIFLLQQNEQRIMMVLIDIPVLDNQEIQALVEAAHTGEKNEIPIIVLIDPIYDRKGEEEAFLRGAADVILKPFSALAVQKKVGILADLFTHRWTLEKMVEEQSETIRNTNQVMLDTLSAIIEYRSTESGNHVLRIRRFTKILLEEVARCCPEYGLTDTLIDIISSASALHDIGKISVPDNVLNKPGALTKEECEIMKSHTTVGGRLVEQLSGMGEELYLRYAYHISMYHHERWDGRGYPVGLAGDAIPICAQVVGLTDAFDALTTKRVYKPVYAYDKAINMILNGECGQFSPKLLECFKHVSNEMVKLGQQYADGYSPKSDNIKIPLPSPDEKTNMKDSFQVFQAKYQSLLQYINDTVLELDVDNGLCHIVYNPNPIFDKVLTNHSFCSIMCAMQKELVHPEDRGIIDQMIHFAEEDFFLQKLHRHTFTVRIFNSAVGLYESYELTFLRVDAGIKEQHIITFVWHKAEQKTALPSVDASIYAAPALIGLICVVLRCHIDDGLTIDQGIENLFSLTGYTKEDIQVLFRNRFIEVISEEERFFVVTKVQNMLRTGGVMEAEFRLLRKNDTPIWVLAKCRTYIEEDGREYLYFSIQDNSKFKAVHHQLISDIKRDQIIIEQSGSIVFEWDIQTDTMVCASKWVEHFGYVPVSKNYGSQVGIATHFHPDDLPLIRQNIENIKQGETTISMDVRIANNTGRYLWTKITATGCRDHQGNLERIIGILQDIDELKRAALTLREQAQKDALTKLLNKNSAQTAVREYLLERKEDSISGLLLLDLDNFKTVNDTLGHMFGDVVLTQVGATLRKLFRSQDIIGRIGGDEFLVLLKDIPNRDVLRERCELMMDTLRLLFGKLTPELPVSCSIGAAMIPEHGETFDELFRHADEALYHVKNKGKNQYKIYSYHDKYTVTLNTAERNTRIDSDDPSTVTNASFERFVFRCMYESRDIDATIEELLAFVGNNFNVSRTYIFENNKDNTECSNTYEWCNEGIEPQKEMLQNVSYITDIPGWPDVYNERGVFYCTDITRLEPQFRAILEPQNIKSMLHIAIMDQNVFRGYVGFDECTSNRLWTQEQLDQLEFLAEVLSVFLIRKRNKENIDAVET